MIKRLWNLLGKNKKLLVIATILVILEIIFDLLIPVYMSDIIDEGIKGNKGVSYVLNLGIRMVLLATIAVVCRPHRDYEETPRGDLYPSIDEHP